MSHRFAPGVWLATTAGLTLCDQLTKFLAVHFLKNAPDLILIPGVFQLSYLENQGAAWGMFRGMRWLFLIFALLMTVGIFYVCARTPAGRRYRVFRFLGAVLAAGALGNAIDRLLRGFVVDFFYFSLIDFPVFNVADCFVCVSLVLLVLLCWRDDFAWLKRKE